MSSTYTVAVTAKAGAPAETVYAIIADYIDGHPRILPRAFRGLAVEKGGVGDGTVIAFAMRVFGRTVQCRAAIREAQPGRVLVETLLDGSGTVTTFTVDRVSGGSQVTISTELPLRPGIAGRIERFFAARYLRGVYREELAILDKVVREGHFLAGMVQK